MNLRASLLAKKSLSRHQPLSQRTYDDVYGAANCSDAMLRAEVVIRRSNYEESFGAAGNGLEKTRRKKMFESIDQNKTSMTQPLVANMAALLIRASQEEAS